MKTEIAHLQAKLDSVKSRYENLYNQLNFCASLITLPRRVPDNVLQEIFYPTLPTNGSTLLDNKAAPLIFTCICHQWCQVPFTTLRLWLTVHIHIHATLRLYIRGMTLYRRFGMAQTIWRPPSSHFFRCSRWPMVWSLRCWSLPLSHHPIFFLMENPGTRRPSKQLFQDFYFWRCRFAINY